MTRGPDPAVQEERGDGAPAVQEERSDGAPVVQEERGDGAPAVQEERSDGAPAVEEERSDGAPVVEEERSDGAPAVEEERSDGAPAVEEERSDVSKPPPPTRRTVSVPDLVERARAGEARAVARLISLVEDASPLLREVMAGLAPYTGHAQIVGVTGAPGVGKSTSTSALVSALRRAGKRVGVLAVDPSSPFSGGALLGDRVRMQDHALDREVYIRSMASRGHLGGLAWSTPQALRVLDAAGCDVVLVETVGVGQSEVEIAGLADTTLVLLAPGMGDGIQAAKAGILEIGDVYVVNKADREGADQVRRDLRNMLALADRDEGAWKPPIVQTVAQTGQGVDEVVERIQAHRAWMEASGELERRRVRRARDEVEAIAVTALRERWAGVHQDVALDDLAAQVARGETDPYTAADELLEAYTE